MNGRVIYLFIFYNYITMHGARNIKLPNVLSPIYKASLLSLFEQCSNQRQQRGTGVRLSETTSSSTPTNASMQKQYVAKGKSLVAVT
jgi:hypothetical protein